jgi:putative endonuclease
MLELSDGSYYTGITNNIDKRMSDHDKGKGSKYVRSRKPFSLIYIEYVANRSEASKREREIKNMRHARKKNLADSPKNSLRKEDEQDS